MIKIIILMIMSLSVFGLMSTKTTMATSVKTTKSMSMPKAIQLLKTRANKTISMKKLAPSISNIYIIDMKFNKFGFPYWNKYSKMDITTNKLSGNYKKDVKIIKNIIREKHSYFIKRRGYSWQYHPDGKKMQYIPNKLYKAITPSTRPKINIYRAGREISIEKLAPHLAEKYKIPIKFSRYSYPNFKDYSIKEISTKRLTGEHSKDVRIVEKIIKKKNPNWKRTKGYSWHHHQNGKTMQYVPTDLHSSIPHSGGASALRDKLKRI